MTFLSPFVGLLAAGAAVPLLVLLYFLKLKRRQLPISSTLLWKRAVQDLQVNAPFQRIRYSILLILQLLILACVLAALSGPVVSMPSGPPKRCVLLMDRSASMNALEGGRTRLDLAKGQARQLVDGLRGRIGLIDDQSDQAMVVAFDEHAKVLCNFTSDRRQLLAAIDAVTPTDGATSLADAVMVAQAFAQSPGRDANNRSSVAPAQLELFSDGRIGDASQILLGDNEMNYHRVGAAADNVAITAMQARRVYERPADVEIFASIANYNAEPVTCDVQMSLDGNIRSVTSVEVPARKVVQKDKGPVPGQSSVRFNLTHPAEGLIEVRQARPDALACDDVAWAVLPAPKSLSVLLVTHDNLAIQRALEACPLAKLDVATPAEFDKLDKAEMAANPKYDLIILDRHAPAGLPRGRYIVFGPPPPGSGAAVEGELANQAVIDWRSRHPVLQYVNLGNLFVTKAAKIKLPSDATLLAEFSGGPAMAIARREGSLFLLAPFDVLETNWPFEPGFVMFCYNATGFLGLEMAQGPQGGLKVHQAISIENLPLDAKVQVSGPAGSGLHVDVDPGGAIRFAATDRAGVYEVRPGDRPKARYAVNLLDLAESDIEPVKDLKMAGQTVAGQEQVRRAQTEIWPYLVLAALLLACVEWVVYNLRIRIG